MAQLKPGCWAQLVGHIDHPNMIVQVGRPLGYPQDHTDEHGPWWEISKPIRIYRGAMYVRDEKMAPEDNLIPWDDLTDELQEELALIENI